MGQDEKAEVGVQSRPEPSISIGRRQHRPGLFVTVGDGTAVVTGDNGMGYG